MKTFRLFVRMTLLVCLSLGLLGMIGSHAQAANSTIRDPARGFPTDRIIIKYKQTTDAFFAPEHSDQINRLNNAAGAPLKYFREMSGNAHVMQLQERLPLEQVGLIAERLTKLPEVEYAEADQIFTHSLTPNDPQYTNQWHYFEIWGINLPAAWEITTGSSGIVVAVIDTGITNHADLSGRTVPGYDFISTVAVANDGNGRDSNPSDPGDWIAANECFPGSSSQNSSWHGTHTAGTIGAASNNGLGVTGVNWNSKILPVRVLGKCGGSLSDIADGMRWSAGLTVSGVPANSNPARVLNLSLGGSGTCSATYQNAINAITAAGSVVVVSAGNSNANASGFQPANCSGVITVAATNRSGSRSYYSNYGSTVEISAPGGETNVTSSNGVLSTLNTGTTVPASDTYIYYQGTSMAAPHITGVVSLMLSRNPSLIPNEILQILQSTANAFPGGSTCNTSLCGSGIVDAGAAVYSALPSSPPAAFNKSTPSNGAPNQLTNPTLSWGPSSGATGFTYCYDTINNSACDTSWRSVISTSAILSGLNSGTTYYWQTRASNNLGTTDADAGTWWSFTTGLGDNDDFANAITVTAVPYSNTQSVGSATTAADDPSFTCASGQRNNTVWYRYTPGANGTLTVNTIGSNYDTVLGVWTGTRGSLTSQACNDDFSGLQSQVQLSVNAGTTYHIEIAAFGAIATDGLSLSVAGPAPAIPTPTYTSTPTNTATSTLTSTSTLAPPLTITASPTSTFTSIPPVATNSLYLSLTANQTVGGIASADEDILLLDGSNWSLFFDGSDVGVGSLDLFAFSIVDVDTILMAFNSTVTLNGLAVTPQDIVRFEATSLGNVTVGIFSMYFDGSDVGFDTAAENIDSVSLLSEARVLISTTGNPAVVGITGGRDEDVLEFTPTSLGDVTSGTWAMYFDGSDVGLAETSGEDIDALDVTSNGNIYLSTLGDFAVTGISGFDEDVFVCVPTSLGSATACNYSPTLYFDGSNFGLAANEVDAINLLSAGPLPTNTPSGSMNTPTSTLMPMNTATWTPPSTATATSPVGSSPTPSQTPNPSNSPSPTNTPSGSDVIFADSFESGNLSAWTPNTIDLGDLSVNPAAALVGSQGMQAVIDDANTIYATDDNPNAESRYRARFYFDPNSIGMATSDAHFIFKGFTGTSTEVLRMEFRFSSGAYQLRCSLLDDGATWISTNWFSIGDSSHLIEFDWRAAMAVGANNGGLTLWIDEIQQQDLTGVDNDTRRVDRARLGALTGIDTGTRGIYYFDAFESRWQTYIGP